MISTVPILTVNTSIHTSDLVIQYKGEEINNLFKSYIEIKNIGNDKLESNDFPELNRLSIITNGRFFNEISIESSDEYMQITSNSISENKIIINFDYFNPKNAIYCNIYHTGQVKICGSIKNGQIIEEKPFVRYKLIKQIFLMLLFAVMVFLIFLIPVVVAYFIT